MDDLKEQLLGIYSKIRCLEEQNRKFRNALYSVQCDLEEVQAKKDQHATNAWWLLELERPEWLDLMLQNVTLILEETKEEEN